VGHVAGTPHGRRSRIGGGIDVASDPHKVLDHGKFARDDGCPEWRYIVEAVILRHLKVTPLLNVRLADGDEILGDVHGSSFAGNEEGCAAISLLPHQLATGIAGQPEKQNNILNFN